MHEQKLWRQQKPWQKRFIYLIRYKRSLNSNAIASLARKRFMRYALFNLDTTLNGFCFNLELNNYSIRFEFETDLGILVLVDFSTIIWRLSNWNSMIFNTKLYLVANKLIAGTCEKIVWYGRYQCENHKLAIMIRKVFLIKSLNINWANKKKGICNT